MASHERGSTSTLSMREKSLIKRRVNREHNSNFRAGYVQINEEYLHKTGIRGRKTYCVYALTGILLLAAFVNLFITFTILGTLKINKDGMRSLEFLPGEELLRFLGDSYMGETVNLVNSYVSSLPDSDLAITADDAEVALKLEASNITGVTAVRVDGARVLVEGESFEVTDPDTGREVFSTDFSRFRFPDEMRSIKINQALTHRVVGDLDKDLKLESGSDVTMRGSEGLDVDTMQVFMEARGDLDFNNQGEVIVEGLHGPYLEWVGRMPYAGSSDPPDLGQDTYKLCVCMPSGKLFAVPSPFTCDQANEEQNPCL